jgi:acid phosphatase type 7
MKGTLAITVAVLVLGTLALAQAQKTAPGAVQITNGPGVQKITATAAEVFWNTNAPSASVVRYGTSRGNLNEIAEEPGGQTSHAVELKNLQPNTTYFFQVDSSQTKGSGETKVKSGIGTFKTKPQ